MATVLIVDDEPIVREVVVRYLDRDGHTRSRPATATGAPRSSSSSSRSGRLGCDAARGRRARALPLDSCPSDAAGDPPDGAGRGGRSDRRARARRRRLRDEAFLAPRARGPGADRFATVRAADEERERYAFGDIEIDTQTREVRKAGGELRLTAEGVRPAHVPRRQPAPRVRPGPADEPRLGQRGSARHRHGDGARQAPAREDRDGAVRAAPSADRVGRRLPIGAVSR